VSEPAPTIRWLGDPEPMSLPLPTENVENPDLSTQYTPETSRSPKVGARCIEDSIQLALTTKNGINKSHAPDDIGWISPATWAAARWDGKPFNVCGKTTAQICNWAFPNRDTMRGLRELFYDTNPFADNVKPTIAEIDAWNVRVIQHFRNIIGAPTEVKPNKCLFLRAQWGEEKKLTRVWDTAEYTDTCLGEKNSHCGARFIPSCPDQIEYLGNPPSPCCVLTPGAEGIFGVDSDLPWSIKLSRIIGGSLCREGLTGHTGPFVGREFVGLAFSCNRDATTLRAKWSGTLQGIGC
jgi:hypothetical protein